MVDEVSTGQVLSRGQVLELDSKVFGGLVGSTSALWGRQGDIVVTGTADLRIRSWVPERFASRTFSGFHGLRSTTATTLTIKALEASMFTLRMHKRTGNDVTTTQHGIGALEYLMIPFETGTVLQIESDGALLVTSAIDDFGGDFRVWSPPAQDIVGFASQTVAIVASPFDEDFSPVELKVRCTGQEPSLVATNNSILFDASGGPIFSGVPLYAGPPCRVAADDGSDLIGITTADGAGTQATVFLPVSEFKHHFATPEDLQFVAIAMEGQGSVFITEPSGNITRVDLPVAGANNISHAKIEQPMPAGTYIFCTNRAMLIADTTTTQEFNLFGFD